MQTKQDKTQKTRNQIQLIKQKYLKKNIPNNTQNQNKQETTITTTSTQIQQQKIKTDVQSTKPQVKIQSSQLNVKSGIKQVVNTKQIIGKVQSKGNGLEQKWSLKKFMQQESRNKPKQISKQNKQQQLQNIKFDEKDPFCLKIPFKFPLQPNKQHINRDPQFYQQKNIPKEHREQNQKNSSKVHHINRKNKQKDLSYACMLWKQNIRKCLMYLYCQNENVQIQPYTLQLKSTNPSFPGIVKQLAQQFIFSNNQLLKDTQKQVVYNMALQYFSPSPKHLSDVLLICLIKMVPNYASIYIDEIIRQMDYYGQKIIQLRRYLLKQQLQNFAKFLEERMQNLRIDGHRIPIQSYIWLLILKPNSNSCHQILLTRNVQNQKDFLAIFCALHPDGKQNMLSILYLKCMDALVPLFIRTGILQKVINQLNQIKVPQVLYQPVKSLKLKLIKAADPKKQKKKVQEDKGFMNFLNQRVVKLKEVVQNKVNLKSKAQVYFNTESCRYQPVPNSNNSKSII